jgi:hypothetical protein
VKFQRRPAEPHDGHMVGRNLEHIGLESSEITVQKRPFKAAQKKLELFLDYSEDTIEMNAIITFFPRAQNLDFREIYH